MGARSTVLAAGAIVAAMAILVASGLAPPAAAESPAPAPGPIPPPSSLPRLRPLWSAPGLIAIPSLYDGSPVRDGTVLAFAYKAPTALVALDLRTGRERWRVPMPTESPPNVALAGDVALAYRSIGATAIDLATGHQRWTKRLCQFEGDLATVADLRIGVGMCRAPDPPEAPDAAPRTVWRKTVAVAIDLTSGRELWRTPAGWPSQAIAAAGGVVYLAADTNEKRQTSVTVSALDPRTGKSLRSFSLTHRPARMHVLPGDATRAVFVGGRIVAVNLTDGGVAWKQDAPPRSTQSSHLIPRPELRAGRLFGWWDDRVRELDLRTGADVAAWTVPASGPGHRTHIVRPAPEGGLLVIKDREQQPALAIRFAGPGAPPTLAVLPTSYDRLVAIEDGIAVVYDHDGTRDTLGGYAAFETIAPEATALDAGARVRAILERNRRFLGQPGAHVPERDAALADLRAVPGFEVPLAAMAGDVASSSHDAAVDAVAAMRLRGAAPILLAEVMRPIGFPPLTGKPDDDRAIVRRFDRGSVAMLRRGDLIVALADLDDPKVADALTPLLFDAESPTGYSLRDWETWGDWIENGYGAKSWAATSTAPETAFSVCLQAPAGRPEAHAAIYRLLARLARPRDVAALRRFDGDKDPAGGWSQICIRDDAIKTMYVDRSVRSNGLGLCQGWDAGAYRLTQSGALWLRRRLPDGTLSPPAWALDPGGDTRLQRRPTKGVTLTADGKVKPLGHTYWDPTARQWVSTLVPAAVFADRDRDGLTDFTEAAFGTDPARPDTDGDGTPDGRDPAPLAPPATSDAARVHDEVVRFWTTFRAGGPLTVYADPASWGGGGGGANAGVVLHRPLTGKTPPVADGKRRCESVLTIEAVTVRGRQAEATAVWFSRNGNGVERKLSLRKVGDVWRVTGDSGPTYK